MPPMKRAVWTQVNLTALRAHSVWVRMNEERLADESLLETLENKFCTKMVRQSVVRIEPSDSGEPERRKEKPLRVLDDKCAKSISIFKREFLIFLTLVAYSTIQQEISK